MNGMPSFADPANLERTADDTIKLEPDATSLTLLQAIYRSAAIPLTTRMRAAIAAIPFEHPKLAVAVHVEAGDFADQLERAVERTRKVLTITPNDNVSSDTANASSDTKRRHVEASNGHKPPSIPDRRYRRS